MQAIMAATDCQTMGTAAGTLVVNLLNAAQDGTNYYSTVQDQFFTVSGSTDDQSASL